MAVSFNLSPIPKWYFADLAGLPLSGGKMYTRRNLVKTDDKTVYSDKDGLNPYTNPIIFDENGMAGPFYWAWDPNDPTETYYLIITDANDVQQFDIVNYFPPNITGGGGGGGTQVVSNLNYVTNNVFWHYTQTLNSAVNVTSETNLLLAPSNHAGFTNGDIRFIRSVAGSTDTITVADADFVIGANPLTGDVTPEVYFQYNCTAAVADAKVFSFPIDLHVKNLETQTMTGMVWAKSNGGNTNFRLYLNQFYGSGPGVSTPKRTLIGAFTATGTWAIYGSNTSFTVPSDVLATLGSCGDNATYLEFEPALGAVTNISFTKPKLYLGTVALFPELPSYDTVDMIVNSPRTGDIRTSINNFIPGWVNMNDGTIGSVSSLATSRANIDTFQLFSQIWNGISNTWAPMTDNAGVATARGGSAAADFAANRRLTLPRALGRVFAGTLNTEVTAAFTTNFAVNNQLTVASSASFYTGVPVVLTTTGTLPAPLALNTTYYAIFIDATHIALATSFTNAIAGTQITLTSNGAGVQTIQVTPYVLGQAIGSEDAILPAHTHTASSVMGQADTTGGAAVRPNFGYGTGANTQAGSTITIASSGVSPTGGNLQPTTYMNVFIKL